MRPLAALAVLLSATLAQVTLAPRLAVAGSLPNLVLLAVLAWTWLRGEREGLAWAAAGGLLLDLTGFGPLGVHALALLAGAYAAGLIARAVHGELWPAAVAAAVATLAYGLVVLGAADSIGHTPVAAGDAAALLAGAALYNALLAVPALLLLSRLERRLPVPAE